MMEIYKGLDKLQDSFKAKVVLWLDEVGDKIFITESWRSQERQNWLYASGRTREGRIVTRTTKSKHTEGLAVDIGFYGETYPNDINKRKQIAEVAKKYGIDWGGDWPSPNTDKPHFQDNGKPLQLKKILMSKYKELFEQEVINKGFTPLFKDHTGDEPLTESDVKYLIDIAYTRGTTKIVETLKKIK